MFFLKFKLIYLRSIAKQGIPTFIIHPRTLIPDGIHLFFLNEVSETSLSNAIAYKQIYSENIPLTYVNVNVN